MANKQKHSIFHDVCVCLVRSATTHNVFISRGSHPHYVALQKNKATKHNIEKSPINLNILNERREKQNTTTERHFFLFLFLAKELCGPCDKHNYF